MRNSNKIISLIMCFVCLTGVLCACSKEDEMISQTTTSQTTTSQTTTSPSDASFSIVFSGESVTVTGDGMQVEQGVVTITKGGVYQVTGEATEGRILVNAPDEEVTLVLDNTDITCSYGSPIYIYKAGLATITLAEESRNIITDGSEYTYEEEEPNACLYSKADLVINGSGQLLVYANYNNGITGKDTLNIADSDITVTAQNHGVNGKDCCIIQNARIQISSGGDALRSTNDSDSTLGYITISDSDLSLVAGEDGIQAQTTLTMRGGTCDVATGGGSGGSVEADSSAKGIKAGTDISLYDGVYTLDCCDDAIHANGNVWISDGTYSIATGDDGIHADENTKITGGKIDITGSYEGVEGATIDISGGTIHIVARDDGINAAGGADQSGVGPFQDRFSASSDYYITISGGNIQVDADGDGVDSNGNLTVSGGELYINGPTNGGNGAIDYDGMATITGGVVVATGSSEMAQNFGEDSTQGSILLSYTSSSVQTIVLKDESGKELLSYSPNKDYNCVVISCSDITIGNSYTIEACGQTSTVTMDTLIYGNSTGMGGRQPGRDKMETPDNFGIPGNPRPLERP